MMSSCPPIAFISSRTIPLIFSSTRTAGDHGYAAAAARMEELAAQQPGYLGIESARSGIGITVSYWSSEDDARGFKRVVEHVEVQRRGRTDWYQRYRVRVATVTREHGHDAG